MATIKVFDVVGERELKCFDTLDDVSYLEEDDIIEDEPEQKNPFE